MSSFKVLSKLLSLLRLKSRFTPDDSTRKNIKHLIKFWNEKWNSLVKILIKKNILNFQYRLKAVSKHAEASSMHTNSAEFINFYIVQIQFVFHLPKPPIHKLPLAESFERHRFGHIPSVSPRGAATTAASATKGTNHIYCTALKLWFVCKWCIQPATDATATAVLPVCTVAIVHRSQRK